MTCPFNHGSDDAQGQDGSATNDAPASSQGDGSAYDGMGVDEGLTDLFASIDGGRTAVMCSEAVWWRCHRRLVADVVQIGYEIPVRHLMHDGKVRDHRPADGARRVGDGQLVWDGGPVDRNS